MYIERARMRGGEKLDGWMDGCFLSRFQLTEPNTHTHTVVQGKSSAGLYVDSK
jgi:hypothetical protein